MADEKRETPEHVKRQLEEDRKAREQSQAEYAERMKGKPTPTPEEIDRAILGEHIIEHEDDGSGPDPNARKPREDKAQTAAKPATYSTRSTTAKPAE